MSESTECEQCKPSVGIEDKISIEETTKFEENFIMEIPKLLKTTKSQEDIVWQARQSYEMGRTSAVSYRRKQLKQLLMFYKEQEGMLKEVLLKDLRKPNMESSIFEIEFLKNDLLYVLANFEAWLKPKDAYKRLMDFFSRPQIYRDPYGVVLIVGAWNYPLQSTLLPLASAIAAGNCAIIQTPPEARHTTAFLRDMLPTYLDHMSYFLMRDTDKHHAATFKFDYIFYTGALVEARRLQSMASKYLTPGTYIVGGKNPVYVDTSADIPLAVQRILWGKCVNAGQTCIGPGYILCTSEVQKQIMQVVPKVIAQFYGENPQESEDYPRIISEGQFDNLILMLKNKEVAYGGQYDRKTLYIQPTILINVSPNDGILHDETYGPILPIVTVTDEQEAAAFLKAREKPLALYIFSKDDRKVDYLLNHTSSGGVTVNDVLMHIATESLPFGGVGASGFGSYHGKATFDAFTHSKSVLKKPLNALVDKIESIRYPPYNDTNLFLLTQLMKKRLTINVHWLYYVLAFLLGVVVGLVAVKMLK